MGSLPYILSGALLLLVTAFLRLLRTLPALSRTRPSPRRRGQPTHLLIVLGSGGHTAEMLSLLTGLDPEKYTHRSYVISSGDDFSAGRAEEYERGLVCAKSKRKNEGKGQEGGEGGGKGPTREGREEGIGNKGYSIHTVPRARHIYQSLLTTPLSCLRSLYACITVLLHHPEGYPDLVLTNGPATSLIVILASTILHYFSFLPFLSARARIRERKGRTRVIYIESWARVRRPSLTGRIVVWCGLCDRVLVQWKGLERKGWGEYKGVLVR